MFPLMTRDNKSYYFKLIKDAVDANYNMIRLWGGASYEDDEFYNQCDEQGLLIWHDFPFANTLYPADNFFMRNLMTETR